jgi:hypothetical protein
VPKIPDNRYICCIGILFVGRVLGVGRINGESSGEGESVRGFKRVLCIVEPLKKGVRICKSTFPPAGSQLGSPDISNQEVAEAPMAVTVVAARRRRLVFPSSWL